jgi:hypothetical protein
MTTTKLTDFKTKAEIAKIKKEGDKIIKAGNIMEYILKTANIFHYGDNSIFRLGILSAIQHSINDYNRGIYINITGTAGKGKTDTLEVLQGLMPDDWVYKTSISPKALYYADEKNKISKANIIFSDDINFNSEDLIETLKKITSKYSSPSSHITIVDKKIQEMNIRSKYGFWFTSVGSLDDSQLASRFINVAINENIDRDQIVANIIGKNISTRTSSMDKFFNVNVCKYIFKTICENQQGVLIPYQPIIRFRDPKDSRLVASFYSILVAVTFLNKFSREIKNDSIISQIEDFEMTVKIIKPQYKNNTSKLSDPELKILKIIDEAKKPITQSEIQKIAKRSAGIISRNLTNILEHVPNVSVEQKAYGNKYYFMTSISEIDMNKFVPNDKLADIYLDLDKYDNAIDGFWRNRGE